MSPIAAFFGTAAIGIDFCSILQYQDIKPPPYICFSSGNVDICFREICSKVLNVDELGALEKRIVVTLCELERIFPPSFFTVLVHLVMHLVSKTKVAGSVHYR